MAHRRLDKAQRGTSGKASKKTSRRRYRLLLESLEPRNLLAGDIAYTTAGAAYSQNFDGLPNTGSYSLTGTAPQSVTAAPINAGASMEGWFVSTANNVTNKFAVSNSITAAVYSYGSSNTERALGGLANGSFAPRYGAVFTNNTGVALGSFSIAFTEEQWWANTDLNGRHVFEYKVGGTSIHDTGFQADSALDLTKIVVGSAQAIVGNNVNNQTAKNKTISGINWAPGETLVIRWSASATPGAQGLAIDNFTFTALPLPDAQPIAQDDGTYAATEDTPLVVNAAQGVLTNDTGLDDGPLSLSVLTAPAHGAVTLNNDGSFTYTPDANFHGNDSFRYQLTDDDGDSATASVTLTVASVDDLPNAVDDNYDASEDTPLVVNASQGVLANDTGLGDGGLVVSLLTAPSHGEVTINNDGSFTYTPAENYAGLDAFTYQVTDADGDSASASVALTIAAANDLPTTSNGSATVDEDAFVEIDLRAFSADVETSDDNLLYQIVESPSHGTLQPVAGQPGLFTYTPSPDFLGDDTFIFRVKDEAGVNSPASQVAIAIGSINDAPVLAPLGDQQINEKTTISFTVSASDPHDTPANNITLAVSGLPSGATFDPITGNFLWTPSESQQGSYSLTFTATDDGTPAGVSSETITITVNAVNDAPVLAPIGDKLVEEETLLSFLVAASDPNDSPANGIMLSVVGLPTGASFDPATGEFLWTPAENQQGTYSITFTATDDGTPNAADSETITITVNEVNDAPVLTAIGDRSGQEGSLLSFFVQASDPNDDPANQVSLSVVDLPTGASFDPATGEFRWLPDFSNIGTHTLTFQATDDGFGNLTDAETITITIGSGNLPPTLDPISDPAPLLEDAPLQSVALSGISQGGDAFGGNLEITAVTDNSNLLSNLVITYSGSDTGSLSYQPVANASGSGTITVTVRDAGFDAVLGTADDGLFARTFTVIVAPVNDEGTAVIQGEPEERSALTVAIADVEGVPANIVYRWEVSTDGSSDWLAIPDAVVATFVPRQSEVGRFLRVVATYVDQAGNPETVTSATTSAVANVNDAPFDLALSNSVMAESASLGEVVGTFSVADPDGDTAFTYSVVDPTGKFACVGDQLVVQDWLDFEAATSYSIEVTVSDSSGASCTNTFTIEVANVEMMVRLVQGARGEEVRIADDAPGGRANDLLITYGDSEVVITSRNGESLGLQGVPGQALNATSLSIPASFLSSRKLVFNLGGGDDVVEVATAASVLPTGGLQLNLGGQAGDTVVLASSQEEVSPSRTWWLAGNGGSVSIASLGTIGLAGFKIAQGLGGSDRFILSANAAVRQLIADGGQEDAVEVHRDSNFTLSDDLLVVGSLNWQTVETIVGLRGIEQARLFGGSGSNAFDLTAWTGSGSISAGAGFDTIKLRTTASNPNITLGNQVAIIGGGVNPQSFALTSVERAELSTPLGDTAAHTFTLQDWTGATDIQAGQGSDTLVVSGNLATYELGPAGAFKIGATGIGTSQGIDAVQFLLGSGNNKVRLLDGFSQGLAPLGLTLQPGDGNDRLEVTGNADFLVSDTNNDDTTNTRIELTFHSSGVFAFDATGFERIALTGGRGNDTFTFDNLSGQGSVNGVSGNDTIRFRKDANFSLYRSLLQVDGRNIGLTNIDTVSLEGGALANRFILSGWTGGVLLDGGSGPGIDTLRAFTSAANVVLTDALLRLDQQTIRLANSIEVAELVGGATDQRFNLSGWSNGAAVFDDTSTSIPASRVNGGGGNDTILLVRDANITVADRWLTYDPVGPSRPKSFALSHIERVEIMGGGGDNFLSAAGFTGAGGAVLKGLGGNDVLIGSSGNDMLWGGDGNDWLSGLRGKDQLFGGLGRDILSGGEDADFLMGGSEDDALITGRTIYDTHRQPIDALMTAWGSPASYNDRVIRLRDQGVGSGFKLNRASVFDDGVKEAFLNDGNASIDDWFLLEATSGRDRDVAQVDAGEIVTDLN
jgi:VCBS repeat-containing protein